MKNKGFTLVELLAVIVILGLILAISVPSAFKISSKVKSKAYKTKIEQIEKGAAEVYGTNNIGLIRTSSSKCAFSYDNDELKEVIYAKNGTLGDDASGLESYPCIRMTISELVSTDSLNYDYKKQCDVYNCPTDVTKKGYYDNVILNPVNDTIINECNLYIYYKYNRAYATFDKVTCDKTLDNPDNGHSYPRMSKKITSTTRK